MKVLAAQLCPTLCDPMDCSLPGFLSPGDLQDPEIEPGSPTFKADALTSEPPGKLAIG